MTLETLKQCRSASLARANVKRRIAELREDATGISGIRYDGDIPHTRGEPLPRQQRYVEALEQLSAEYAGKDPLFVCVLMGRESRRSRTCRAVSAAEAGRTGTAAIHRRFEMGTGQRTSVHIRSNFQANAPESDAMSEK